MVCFFVVLLLRFDDSILTGKQSLFYKEQVGNDLPVGQRCYPQTNLNCIWGVDSKKSRKKKTHRFYGQYDWFGLKKLQQSGKDASKEIIIIGRLLGTVYEYDM